MTIGARIGLGILALAVLGAAAAGGYLWKRPLRVYAAMNRRALARAGLVKKTVQAPLGRQAYWTGGQGPAVVLLHGAGDSAATWAGVAAGLAPHHRLVIPDLAGHGESEPGAGPLSIGQVLAGLDAVLAQQAKEGDSPGPAIVVGNSLGAWVALLDARRHPERVARVVLVNGGALRGERGDLSLMPKTRREAAALMRELRDPSAARVPGFVLDDVVRTANAGPIARLAQTSGEMGEYLLDGRLAELATPVDLLWGESDKLFPLAYARRMMAELRSARLTVVPACGHVPHQECPNRFQEALARVLAMPPPDAPSLAPAAMAPAQGSERAPASAPKAGTGHPDARR